MKISIEQSNYDEIIQIAHQSNSKTDLIKKLGWGKNSTQLKKLSDLLAKNKFDSSIFPKLSAKNENSILNHQEKLTEVVKKSYSYSDILKEFNIKKTGKTLETLKKYIERFNLSIKHFNNTQRLMKEDYIYRRKNEEIFIENSPVETSVVKKRILKENLIEYRCAGNGCGNEGIWHGVKMTLQLEHINGNNRDHLLENLCFLCPNCHSITKTWGGRNKKKKEVKKEQSPPFITKLEKDKDNLLNNLLIQFNSKTDVLKYYGLTLNTNNRKGLDAFLKKYKNQNVINFLLKTERKVNYPPIDELLKLIEENGFVKTGKILSCSDNAIRKYLKRHQDK